MIQNNFSILYAEDDETVRKKYTKLLRLYFQNVYEAHDGDEALKLYTIYKPNMAILDINMPKKDGLSVAKQIRLKDDTIILIMLTAYSDKEKLLEAIELNLSKYLIKPIKTFELEDIITKAISDLKKLEKVKNIIFLDGGYKWHINNEELHTNTGEIIKLTQKELLLLKLFCENKHHTFSNDEIISYIWANDTDDYNPNKLRIIFSKLKTKLSHNLFHSIYNVGYKLKLK